MKELVGILTLGHQGPVCPEYGVHIVKVEILFFSDISLIFLLATRFLRARYRIPPFNCQRMSLLRKTGERYNRATICMRLGRSLSTERVFLSLRHGLHWRRSAR